MAAILSRAGGGGGGGGDLNNDLAPDSWQAIF